MLYTISTAVERKVHESIDQTDMTFFERKVRFRIRLKLEFVSPTHPIPNAFLDKAREEKTHTHTRIHDDNRVDGMETRNGKQEKKEKRKINCVVNCEII